jgi:hypothetical protein
MRIGFKSFTALNVMKSSSAISRLDVIVTLITPVLKKAAKTVAENADINFILILLMPEKTSVVVKIKIPLSVISFDSHNCCCSVIMGKASHPHN